jgi:hypothetical protein
MQANFPNDKRFASIIFVADNVLTPEVIQVSCKLFQRPVLPDEFAP